MSKAIPRQIFLHPFLQSLKKTIEKNALLTKNESVLIGLSGGADSVSLLFGLLTLGYECYALHCNFHLRGEDSNDDEDFCKKLCQRLNVPLEIIQCNTEEYAQKNKISIEMSARDLRYALFQEYCSKHKISKIAIAHHLKDNVETLIDHIARGSGVKGLRGIPIHRDNIIRPLLDTPPNEIYSFLSLLGEKYQTDQTNSDTQIQRNYIRHKIIPSIEAINPNFIHSSERIFQNLRETEILYDYAIKTILEKAYLSSTHPIMQRFVSSYDCKEIIDSRYPLTILHSMLSPLGFTRADLENFSEHLSDIEPATLSSKTHLLIRSFRAIHILEKKHKNSIPPTPVEIPILDNSGAFTTPFGKFKYCITESQTALNSTKEISIDISKFPHSSKEPIILDFRFPSMDTRISPIGMLNRSKTIKTILKEKKVLPMLYNQIPLLYISDEPIWLVASCRSNKKIISPETSKILILEFIS